jgi:hypothetical protein
MKRFVWMLLSISLSASAQVVTVNGMSVDLTPLTKWLANPQGERPLKHWKQIAVIESKGVVDGRPRYTIKPEDEEQLEVSLMNVPDSVKSFVVTMKAQEDEIKSLRAQIKENQRSIDRAKALTPEAQDSDEAYLLALDERSRISTYQERLYDASDKLAPLERDYAEKVKVAKRESNTLAMFTGASYAGVPIWDCGQR